MPLRESIRASMHKSLFLPCQIRKTRAIFFARILGNSLMQDSTWAGLKLLFAELVRHCLYLVHTYIVNHAGAHRREHRLHGFRSELSWA